MSDSYLQPFCCGMVQNILILIIFLINQTERQSIVPKLNNIMPSKAEKKEQKKIIQDRTFGLKNKNKSTVVQKFVKGVENTVKNSNVSQNKLEAQFYKKKQQKKRLQEEKALLNALYANTDKKNIEQTSSEDEDPANVVCPYFKQGLCQKGKKCIYSHDLTLGRTEEIDLYVDQRTQLIMNAIGGKQLDKMSEEEVNNALGNKQKQMMKGTRSNIVCKFFLEAAEKSKYGWKWNCPNGQTCKYKHCLPPGYKLKKDQKGNAKIQIDEISIEQKIDEQRNILSSMNKTSPLVTFEVFTKWKADRKARKEKDQQKKKKQEEKKKGIKGQLKTGMQLFRENKGLFVDDEEALDEFVQEEEEEIEEVEEKVERNYDADEDQMEEKEQESNEQ